MKGTLPALGADGDLRVAEETNNSRTGCSIVHQQALFPGRVGIVAAHAAQFPTSPARVNAALDGMIVAEPECLKDVPAVGLVRMAVLAQVGTRLGQQRGSIGRMRIVARQAVTTGNGGMDVFFREVCLVMAHIAEVRNRGSE